MLSTVQRLPELQKLIDQKMYFVLHAPRQVGKTTTLVNLAQQLTAEGRYASVVVSMEVGAAFPNDIGAAENAILDDWLGRTLSLPVELQPPPWPVASAGQRIGTALRVWSQACPRPVVIFLDEIDALQDQALLSVLRQLRSGFSNRPTLFSWSLGLIEIRDVRDYKIASGGSPYLQSSSPFNIKVESLTLGNFTFAEVTELYAQHTTERATVAG